MDDLISRQMLLEYIHGEPVGRLLCDKYNLDGLIKQFPSAQPQWIPCSEETPKENGFYLLSSGGTVLIAYYSDGEWLSELPLIMTENNTAWMPLPQPYKGGQDG